MGDLAFAFGNGQSDTVSGSLITQTDLIHRFGERELIRLTDRAAQREIVGDVLQKAINDAEAEVLSYLAAAGFRQPLANQPAILTIKTCDICRWYLYENGIPEVVQKRYDEAVAWFKLLLKNPAMLGGDVVAVDLSAAQQNHTPVFIGNTVEDWRDVAGTF